MITIKVKSWKIIFYERVLVNIGVTDKKALIQKIKKI